MSETLLILAPRGRDATIIDQVLQRGGIAGQIFPHIHSLCDQLVAEIGGLIFTEEALIGPDVERLLTWFASQPAWSDLPVVVLASKQTGRRSVVAASLLERLGNVVILERPINAETLLSGVRSALRVRLRQYQARTYLEEREDNEKLLKYLNETLESRVQERAQELSQARANLAFALESAGMGSWDLDLVSDDSRRTPRHDNIFGYPEPLAHWNRDVFLQHVVEEDRHLAEVAFSQAERTGSFDLECKIRRIDGDLRWISAKGRVAYSGSGAPQRMVGVIMDISDRRFAEEALRQSQKMQAIGQLTGGLAHDFNNLLAGITGSLELMQSRIAQGRVKEIDRYINAAQGAAKRAAALTHRLLAFSRRQTLDPKPTNVNRLIMDMEELVRRTVGPVIHLEAICATGLWPTLCDPNQLENALLNCCINSRDAMPDGGRLTLETANTWLDEPVAQDRDMAPDQYVVLSFRYGRRYVGRRCGAGL